MKTQIEILANALGQSLAGEPAPSFKTPEFAATIAACKALGATGREALLAREALGAKVIQMLLDRNLASMHGERAMAIMRDVGQDLC